MREQLPLSLLNDLLYCPRRAALKVLEGWRGANQHTARGDIVHEHADLPGYDAAQGVTLLRALPVWSERHAAFAAGVGTFGLHQGLITVRGVYGRLASVVTTLKLEPTVRPYREVYGYCLYAHDGSCNACVTRCPSGAVTPAGKKVELCPKHGNGDHFKAWGYGACGHCSTFVPCSRELPKKLQKIYGQP